MTRYYVEVRYLMCRAERQELDQHTDDLMEALAVEPRLIDPDVGVNFELHAIDVCAMVDADDEPDALGTALVAVRSAAHHAGAPTPGWEAALQQIVGSVRPAEMADG